MAAAVVVFAVPPLWFEIAITFMLLLVSCCWHSVTPLFLAVTLFNPSGFPTPRTLAIATARRGDDGPRSSD